MSLPLAVQQLNLLPTVYFTKITLENASGRDLDLNRSLPIMYPGDVWHPEYKPEGISGETLPETVFNNESDKRVRVTLNVEIKFEFETTDTSQVVLDEDLFRFINISIDRYSSSGDSDVESREVILNEPLSNLVGGDFADTHKYSPVITNRNTFCFT